MWHRSSNKIVCSAKKIYKSEGFYILEVHCSGEGVGSFPAISLTKRRGGTKKSSLKVTVQLLGNVPGMAANNSCCTYDSHQ